MMDVVQEPVSERDFDCAVCLQKCHHPTQLPCGHIFCFLCVKGVTIQSKKCAMCRAQIPSDYLEHPILLEKVSTTTHSEEDSPKYQWFYEGRNGWWKYDERSNVELEMAFSSQETECSLLLAGALYIIDFQNMVQVRRNDPTRRRRVRRDTPTLPAKGIAGIKIQNMEQRKNEDESPIEVAADHSNNDIGEVVTINEVAVNPDNDILTENSTLDNEVSEITARINTVHIQSVEPSRNEDSPSSREHLDIEDT